MRNVLQWIVITVGSLLLVVCIAAYRAAGYLEKSAPKIANIDLYGLKTVSGESVRGVLGVKEGDFSPPSPDGSAMRELAIRLVASIPGGRFASIDRQAMIQRLKKLPGVEDADVSTIINPGATATLFVGIQEHGETGFTYRPAPSGRESLPREIIAAYDDDGVAMAKAIRNPNSQLDEDDSQGHALFTDPAMRAAEQKAIDYDKLNLSAIAAVLRDSSSAREREAAAWAMGYAPDKRAVVPDLIDAAHDPDERVRNNATRALGVIAEYAAGKPETGIHIDPAPFVGMLNSVVWTDRNKATMVLLSMSPESLQPVRDRMVPALIEMAHWKDKHFEDALRLLGRIAGMNDDDVEHAIAAGERDRIINFAIQPRK